MADLTGIFKTTKHLLDGGEVVEPQRPYLGMSGLGHFCSRYLWYGFRFTYKSSKTKRIIRLLKRGHREEEVLIGYLREVGIEVTNAQAEMVAGFGHIKGHNDGVAKGMPEAKKNPHVLEIKAIADTYFKALQKKGSIKKYSYVYYAQATLYMHHLKMNRCLFIVVNKNTDEIYIERIEYDPGEAEDLLRKGESILMAQVPPERPPHASQTYFECKWCDAKDVCYGKKPMEKSCRSCTHVDLEHEGKWSCGLNPSEDQPIIPLEVQRVGCKHYQAVPNEHQ